MRRWLGGVAMSLNQLFNALTGGNPDEAFSSRVGHARDAGSRTAAGVCHVLDWIDLRDGDGPRGDHCTSSVAIHQARVRAEATRTGIPVGIDLAPP